MESNAAGRLCMLMCMESELWCGLIATKHGTKCGIVLKYYNVIPIWFGWFLRVPFLHVLFFIQKNFL